MSGPVLQTYAIVFFEKAGMSSSQAFYMGLGLYAVAFVGTVLSWPMINRFGRRTIFLSGLAGCFVTLMIVGFIGLGSAKDASISCESKIQLQLVERRRKHARLTS